MCLCCVFLLYQSYCHFHFAITSTYSLTTSFKTLGVSHPEVEHLLVLPVVLQSSIALLSLLSFFLSSPHVISASLFIISCAALLFIPSVPLHFQCISSPPSLVHTILLLIKLYVSLIFLLLPSSPQVCCFSTSLYPPLLTGTVLQFC